MSDIWTCAACQAWFSTDPKESDIVKKAKAEEKQRIMDILSDVRDEFNRRPSINKEMNRAFGVVFEKLNKA